MTTPTYREAIDWICRTELPSAEEASALTVAELPSVALVAHLWGVGATVVAGDLLKAHQALLRDSSRSTGDATDSAEGEPGAAAA